MLGITRMSIEREQPAKKKLGCCADDSVNNDYLKLERVMSSHIIWLGGLDRLIDVNKAIIIT